MKTAREIHYVNYEEFEEDAQCRGLIIAAMFGLDEGMPEEHIKGIWNEFEGHCLMSATWQLVFAGELAVKWDEEAKDACFSLVNDADERAKRRREIQGAMELRKGNHL